MESKFWLLAVTLSSLYAATRTQHVEKMLAAENACMVKYPSITPAVLNELKDEKDLPRFQASHSDLNCFVFCVGVELKMVDQDGVFHLENMKKFTVDITNQKMTHDEAHTAVKQCTEAAVHEDKCERAGQYVLCKIELMKDIQLELSRHEV